MSHLFSKNQDKLNEQRCFRKLLNLLPKRFKDAVIFGYKKQNTLYIALKHPGMKMEFNYNQTLINELLNKLKISVEECKNFDVKQIKTFVTNKKLPVREERETKLATYLEKSSGKFENMAKTDTVSEMIEKIRETIRKNVESK
ncbi:hypothetical protein [Nitrosophilus alvini]|uniref:hypothetical protein n=1 Tax=Nitrosophilus alvini TaxID=2714855 RepID=UPI00190A3E47|nr:hypothetical protein [Nitrosophilus alvini]